MNAVQSYSSRFRGSVLAGAIFAAAAAFAAVGGAFFMGVIGDSEIFGLSWLTLQFVALAAISAFIPACIGWYLFVANAPTIGRGGIVGFFVGLAAHPLLWLSLPLGYLLVGYQLHELGLSSDLGRMASEVLTAIYVSLLFVGWLTGLIGAIVGILLVYWNHSP